MFEIRRFFNATNCPKVPLSSQNANGANLSVLLANGPVLADRDVLVDVAVHADGGVISDTTFGLHRLWLLQRCMATTASSCAQLSRSS